MLGPLLNRKSDLSVRKWVLLYKQLIHLMTDYACPVWSSAARTHVRRLQVLQSKCVHLATGASWYVNNRQIHQDLGFPLFANHIRACDCELWLKVNWHEEPPSTATRQILTLTEGWLRRLMRKSWVARASRAVEAITRDGQVD